MTWPFIVALIAVSLRQYTYAVAHDVPGPRRNSARHPAHFDYFMAARHTGHVLPAH